MRNFWCEVDLDKLDDNIKKIRETTEKKIMTVVKGNAYGLGIGEISSFLDDKVDAFAVVTIEEALSVKSEKDILILNPVLSDEDLSYMKDNFIVSVDEEGLVKRLNETGKIVRVHIYVDTGMNRFGVKPDNLPDFIDTIEKNYPNIKIEGLYTHLHNAHNRDYTLKQIDIFKDAVVPYKSQGMTIHLLNSPGFLNFNSIVDFDDMIRVGNLIYGYDAEKTGYKRIFSYNAVPLRVYNVKSGEYIGYGNKYKASKDVRVGILDVGLIDSFHCTRNVKRSVFYDIMKTIYHHYKYYSGISCKGRVVRIIGSPNMNFTIINMEDFDDDSVFKIDMVPITADSSIPKKYRKGDKYVQL